jgi:hypothetical protein
LNSNLAGCFGASECSSKCVAETSIFVLQS